MTASRKKLRSVVYLLITCLCVLVVQTGYSQKTGEKFTLPVFEEKIANERNIEQVLFFADNEEDDFVWKSDNDSVSGPVKSIRIDAIPMGENDSGFIPLDDPVEEEDILLVAPDSSVTPEEELHIPEPEDIKEPATINTSSLFNSDPPAKLAARLPREATNSSDVRSESNGIEKTGLTYPHRYFETADATSGGDSDSVGHPESSRLIRMMYDEIINGLNSRNMASKYGMFRNYAGTTLNNTRGVNTGSEIDGRFRLSWYDRLFRDPIRSVFEVEEFSRTIHAGLNGDHKDLAVTFSRMREKLDVPARTDGGVKFAKIETPLQAVQEVRRCITEAQMYHAKSMASLSPAEQNDLATNLYSTFNSINGHTIPQRGVGKRLCSTLMKMDRASMHNAAEALLPLTNPEFLEQLDKLPENAFPTVMMNGKRVQRIPTPAGTILIGGREDNIYDLDAMMDVVCVIDLGGNDTYREGTCNVNRPVFVIIDLHGNDTYTGSKPGIQGASILGVSMLLDLEGDDTYRAQDAAQGTTIGGAGILMDYSGNDTYLGLRRAQGCALGGLGVLIDKNGHDDYRAALWAQGFGHPGGFGVLEDSDGNDHYYVGGLYIDSYPEHPGYDGWGQGVGAGIRQTANGGVGMILDGGGDDTYEFDYFAHGGGYWLGVGVARDFGGNDKRLGATLTAYNGGPRSERRWQRFSNGFGCHYALGFLFDDGGDDSYDGTIMGLGMAWDLSIGFLCDFGGNDKFLATGGMTQGVGAEGSIGILFNYGGDNTYNGRNQAIASSNITYHSPSNCGSNFSFLIDYGGKDQYGCGASNNTYIQRGSAGGFLIDRPFDDEQVTETVTQPANSRQPVRRTTIESVPRL